MRVVGPLLFQATFNCAPYPPVLSGHPGCLGLLRWGVAVSPYPQGTSSPDDSSCPRGCVVSVPLPQLSPNHFRGPPFSRRRDLPQLGPKALPSVALPLPTLLLMRSQYINERKVESEHDMVRMQPVSGIHFRSCSGQDRLMQSLITVPHIPKKAMRG